MRVRDAAGRPGTSLSANAEHLEAVEREAILQALRNHNFNRTETAKALDISRRALLYKLQHSQKLGYETRPP